MNGSQSPGALSRRAEQVFDRLSPYEGDGLRNHCRRLSRLVCLLLEREGLPMSRELVHAVAMVHDLGLVCEDVQGANYLERSRALFHRELRTPELTEGTLRIIDQCLLFNHRVRPVRGLSLEAECFRRAVWVEHFRGARRYGLDRAAVGQVFKDHPRGDLDRVLMDFVRRVLRREPRTLLNGIFF